MSTRTQHFNFVKPQLSDPADITMMNENWDNLDNLLGLVNTEVSLANNVYTAVGTHNQYSGSVYAVTVPEIIELYAGLKLTIIPDSTSVIKYCYLNVNELGKKYLMQPISSDTASASYGSSHTWIQENVPIEILFDGNIWRVLNITAPDAECLVGSVPINKGGTGATNAADALKALGGVSRTLLWENTSITTEGGEFAAQSISIDNIDTYDGFEIVYTDCAGSQFHLYSTGFIPYYRNQMINLSLTLLDGVSVRGCRMSGTGIFMFENECRGYGSDAEVAEDNTYCIPYKIYGIKGVQTLA